MNSAVHFSSDYAAARTAFRAAAAAAGGQLDTRAHPERGPDGGDLTTDIAWLGPTDASRVMVMISGTHGVEGFCGSGAQVDWLTRAEPLPADTAVLLIHAINPYGFAWLRRVTHENVDLNRNWIDFAAPLPENAGYDGLADAIAPSAWDEAGQQATGARLMAYAGEHGFPALQQAISGGQYRHPDGLFFGGTGPTWSHRTQTEIFQTYLNGAGKVAILDYHTGLGPWGFGEQIISDRRGTAGFARAERWFGVAVTSPAGGDSTSADIAGDGLAAAAAILPHAEVTGVALEVGTKSVLEVLDALRADNWLHHHGDPASPQGQAIKRQIRDAFYGDADDWKGMVAGQSLLLTRQALRGLSA